MDGWRLVSAARSIGESHVYAVSRFPGFPVHEILSALLWCGGPYVLNGASAVMSAWACVVFAAILRVAGCGQAFLGGVVLGSVPAIFLYSACPLDYIWALSLVLTSFYLLLAGRWGSAGVILGIAAGCRVSTLGLLAPFALLALDKNPQSRRSDLLRFTLACLVVTGLCFLPVLLRYGFSFLRVYQAPYPGPARLAYRASIELWGIPGALAMTILAAAPAGWMRLHAALASPTDRPLMAAAASSIGVTVVTFLLHPDKSVYLIPAVPFTLLLAWKTLTPGVLRRLSGALLVSPLILSVLPARSEGATSRLGRSLDFTLAGPLRLQGPGPVFVEAKRRRERGMELERLGSALAVLPVNSVLVAGWWFAEIRAAGLDREAQRLEVVQWIDEPTYQEVQRQGRAIYVAPGQSAYNLSNAGFDLERAGARTLETPAGSP